MLPLNKCIIFAYVLLYFNAISECWLVHHSAITTPSTTTSTTTSTATTPRYDDIARTEKITPSENRPRIIQNDPLMRLTQLMAVQLEGKSEGVKSVLKDIIHDEVEQIIKGLGFDKSIRSKQAMSVETDNSSYGKDTLLLLLDNLAKEVTSLRSSVGSLKSDIELSKSNNHSNVASKVYFYEHKTKPLSNKTPIGINYDPKSKVDDESTAYRKIIPRDCEEVRQQGNNSSGIYKIQPRTSRKPFMVLCDMETRGGGWAHIQKRFDGSQDFYLDWRNYKFGFGDLDGEFWLGLENIFSLVGFEVNELLVEIVDRDNVTAYAHYKAFGIGPEADGYHLNVLKGFSGDAGDSFVYHLGSKFTTKDFDQDVDEKNCAEVFEGAWWYKSCYESNLNGRFMNVAVMPKDYKFHGMHWKAYRSLEYCHAKSRMMVRPAKLI